jgi:hypothetical protein
MKQHKKLTQAIRKARDHGKHEKVNRADFLDIRKASQAWKVYISAPTSLTR